MNQQRALRQYLEDYQRAGLDRIAVEIPETVVAAAHVTETKPASQSVVNSTAEALSGPPTIQETHRQPTLSARPSMPAGPRSDKSLTDRIAALQVLAGACAACTKCGELASSRKQTVFGVGNPQASIMFVGEAPGADEDAQGEPFVGKAGQLLDKIIGACHLKREDIYICNILRCRPPGNRNPTPEEAANCREFLDGQIEIVDPDYIVCWGGVAAQNLLGIVSSVGKLRGRILQHGRSKVVCTYHPSYLLRNPAAKKQVWEDMKFLFADMGVDL